MWQWNAQTPAIVVSTVQDMRYALHGSTSRGEIRWVHSRLSVAKRSTICPYDGMTMVSLLMGLVVLSVDVSPVHLPSPCDMIWKVCPWRWNG
jgi:hypothetical protein